MEEELHERPLYRQFAGLYGAARLLDETTILRFRHLLEEQQIAPEVLRVINDGLSNKGLLLETGASLIAAPSSTKNSNGERDPEMHQTKKGNQWHFA